MTDDHDLLIKVAKDCEYIRETIDGIKDDIQDHEKRIRCLERHEPHCQDNIPPQDRQKATGVGATIGAALAGAAAAMGKLWGWW